MKVALNITRVKRENEIDEIFHYNPDHQFCYDDKRGIHYRLWHKRNQLSIHKIGYKLIQITYLNKQIALNCKGVHKHYFYLTNSANSLFVYIDIITYYVE